MDSVVETAIKNPSDQENFAKWIGIDPDTLKEPPVAAAETDEEPVEDAATDEPAETPEDAAEPEADTGSETADPEPEPVKLPFEAKAKDESVDPTLLASMEITLKADGKEVTLPLADVVRRAQSEPAAQRQARAAAEQVRQLEQTRQQIAAELEEVRSVALRMARDPNFYAEVISQVEGYDAPEARAERAERQLAAERARLEQERQQQQFQSQVQSFAVEVVAPTLNEILEAAPLVKQEELLGKFYADTAAITVNGIIPPEYHADLAAYLRSEFADFAKARQAEETAREQRIRAEAKKTQMERQRLKNQTAQAAKPVGASTAPGREGAPTSKPRTVKEAEAGALSALLGTMQ